MGLSQAAFARQICTDLGQYKKYEQNRNVPGGSVLAAIAKTGVNVNWLLTGEGQMRMPVTAPPSVLQAAEPPPPMGRPDAGPPAMPPSLQRYERRIEALLGLLGAMPGEEAAALIDEAVARASTAQQLADLKQAVQQLTAAKRKSA